MMSQSDLSKMQYDGLAPTIATRQLPRSGFVQEVKCGVPKNVAQSGSVPRTSETGDCCATYLERLQGQRNHRLRKKAMTSGCLDHPPFIPRVAPRANVASARSFVARSIST